MPVGHGDKSLKRHDYTNARGTRTVGWYVRVWWNGKWHQRLFTDVKHGGKQAAYQAAKAYRDQLELDLGKPRTDQQIVQYAATATGIQGVYVRVVNNYKNKTIVGQSLVVEAVWYDNGKRKSTHFSAEKRTLDEAIQLAVEARESAIAKMRENERRQKK